VVLGEELTFERLYCLQRKDADIVYKRLPELMEDLPPRGPPQPRLPETLLPLPPGHAVTLMSAL
jgi:hypothetical protein